MQKDEPADDVECRLQLVQLAALAAENVPLAHIEQLESPLAAYDPAGHEVQVTFALDPLPLFE